MIGPRIIAGPGEGTFDHIEGSLIAGALDQMVGQPRPFKHTRFDNLPFDMRLASAVSRASSSSAQKSSPG